MMTTVLTAEFESLLIPIAVDVADDAGPDNLADYWLDLGCGD